MDVRCERCRAQYVFDDEQVTPQGLTVQCTNCGHVFKVKKKELVVTVPVRPEDVTEQPMLATAAAPRSPAPARAEAPQGWTIRQAGGTTLTFTELTTLQKWIVERKVSRDDEVSQGDEAWVRLGAIGELVSFFEVVDAAERGRRPPPMTRPGGTDFYPPPPFPPPSFAPPPAAPPPAAPPQVVAAPAPGRRPPPPVQRPDPVMLTAELGPEELAAVRGRKGGRARLAVTALLLVTLGAIAYVFAPALSRQEPAGPGASAPAPQPPSPPAPGKVPEPAPPSAEPRPPEPATPAPPPAATAAPAPPEEKAPVREEKPPTPEPAAGPPPPPPPPAPTAATPARPTGTRALLAQADGLRSAKAGGRADTARALDLYGQVLATEPGNVNALTGRGLCYFELGQYAPAEASFQRALQLARDLPEAIMGLAETYRSQGKNAEALPLYEQYLAEHPDGDEAPVARYAIGKLKE